MIFTSKIKLALERATTLHDGQYRKDGSTPYIAHPVAVAMILAQYTSDEDIICAGLLHDVLEDVAGYFEQDMRVEFGDTITDIVKGVTEPKDPNKDVSEQLPWREIKEKYMENLRTAPSGSVMVAAADKIHNLESFISLIEREGKNTWKIFNSAPEERIWYFDQVLAIVADRVENELVDKFRELNIQFQEAIATRSL